MSEPKKCDANSIKNILDLANIIGTIFLIMTMNNKNNKNYILSLLFISSSFLYLLGRLKNNNKIIALFHIVWAVLMFILPFISKDENLLFFHLSLIILTLATRKIFHGCMVRVLEGKNLKLTNNGFTKLFNWDLIFPFLGFFSTIRLRALK